MKQLLKIMQIFKRNKLNSSVIIISLAVGMACFLLISVFIQRELNPESFNPDRHRIFALQTNNPFGAVGGDSHKMLNVRYGSAEYMKENFAEVESFCRITHNSVTQIKANNNSFYNQPVVLNASSNFFNFFSYTLLSRNEQTVLKSKNDIAISKELAIKYFGNEMPIGKPIKISFKSDEKEFLVRGVFEKPYAVTQFDFDMVILFHGERDSRCYVKLDSPLSRQKMEQEFERLKDEIPVIKGDTPNQYDLLPMNEAYFSSMRRSIFDLTRDKADLWIAILVALLILGVALFNYLILIKNRLNDNSKNYIINRMHGASNKDLTLLFMREVFAIIVVAIGLGILLLKLLIPYFNELLKTTIAASAFIQFNSLVLTILLLGLVAIISYFFVLIHIRTKLSTTNMKGSFQPIGRRINAMNIFQLAAMIILVISSFVIIKQIQFVNNKEIGLDKNVMAIKIPQAYKNLSKAFKEELRANPNIKEVALTPSAPFLGHFKLLLNYDDNGVKKEYYPCLFSGDASFVKTLGIRILEGEGFSGNPEVDKHKCLINKSLANLFPNQQLIGKGMPGNSDKIIIGIVDDFHFSNLKRRIEPGFIEFSDEGQNVLVKAIVGQEKEVEASIADIWSKLIPDYPVNFESLDLRFKSLHDENKNFIRLIGSCSIISIFLSMMGLFAISVDKSIKLTKEIGIRKVNGASVLEIIQLLNKDFVKWVSIAYVIAVPVAWYAMNEWLKGFAYKTELSWWIFILAGLMALFIALITISWQSFKAARRNPIDALRYE